MSDLQALASAKTSRALAQMDARHPYQHQTYTNPYARVPDAFSYGVYESPGQTAGLFDLASNYTLPGMVTDYLSPTETTLQGLADQATNVKGLGYDPTNETGLESAARWFGQLVGDPFNALGVPRVAGHTLQALARNNPFAEGLVNQAMRPYAKDIIGGRKAKTLKEIIDRTKADQGYLVNLNTTDIPDEGYMVGYYPQREQIVDELTKSRLKEYMQKNESLLAKDENYLGTWLNPESNQTYLDISKKFPQGGKHDLRAAIKAGDKKNQLAIWDAKNANEIIGGSWEDFVRSSEYGDRLHELDALGAQYMSKHPNWDWWNLNNTGYERVYGKSGLQNIAGYNAATSPMKLLRDNTADATEYMRRKLAGEDIRQPNYRTPDDALTIGSGLKMRNETSQAPNLARVTTGNPNELRQDKVNNMYLAQMGDPDALALDTYWAKISEDPARNIYSSGKPGIIEPGNQYAYLKDIVRGHAKDADKTLNTFGSNVWTGAREQSKTGLLFGQPYPSKNLGESKSLADYFTDLVNEKAVQMKVSPTEIEKMLAAGKISLL